MTSEFAVAVHALVFLNHKGETLPSESLAENVCTNPARIRKVMAKLKREKIVGTKEGLNGGYMMIRSAADISLRQICEALEAEVVTSSWHSGSSDMKCLVASGMAGIMDEIYDKMNGQCKEILGSITIQDIDNRIFGGNQPEIAKSIESSD